MFIFVFVLCWVIGGYTQSAYAQEPDSFIKASFHYVNWVFETYAQPDFKAEKVGTFLPQNVLVTYRLENGWAFITTPTGTCWVYLRENKIYLDRDLSLFDQREGETVVGTIGPQIVKVFERDYSWIQIDTWMGKKWVNLDAIRTSVSLDVPIYNQQHLGYYTGCEIVAVSMMLNYTTEVSVQDLVAEMPYSSDPNQGFRGDPSTTGGFTIFPQALVGLVTRYLGSAQDMTGCEIDDLKEKLNDNIPVVAWVSGLGFNVHAICLTGYNAEGFYYNDPWTGGKDTFITYDSFYQIWNKPINDRLYGISYPTRKALSYFP